MHAKAFFLIAVAMETAIVTATSLSQVELTCGNCGAKNDVVMVASTNQMHAPDLDGRPGEMARSAMIHHVQECSRCHYCSVDLAQKPRSEAARKVIAEPMPEKADRFARAAEIEAAEAMAAGTDISRYLRAGWLFLGAAWTCDDQHDAQQAVVYRRRAAEMLETGNALAVERKMEIGTASRLMLCDIYRRIGDFDKAENVAQSLLKYGGLAQKIADLQLKLCRAKDTACHTQEEILGKDFTPSIMTR